MLRSVRRHRTHLEGVKTRELSESQNIPCGGMRNISQEEIL